MVRIKTKLSLGLGFLFAVIVLLTVAGLYALNRLSADAQAVLEDNYISLQFVDDMRDGLDDFQAGLSNHESFDSAMLVFIQIFETNLAKQEANITEAGEKEATQSLRAQFEALKKDKHLSEGRQMIIRDLLHQIGEVNMDAIVRKNEAARQTAERANFLLGIVAVLCFLISFVFIVNFPGYIADPIRQLTESIRQVADKNYSERLYFKSHDEFGELATAFNDMAARLDDYEHSNLAELLFEKKRLETLLDNMSEAVLVLDENRRVLFCNPVACQLMGIKKTDLIGKYAPDAALHNDLLRTLLQTTGTDTLKIFYDNKESFFQKETFAVRVERPNVPSDAGAVILLKNITPFKELDQAKTNFIATISHELKTPISSIKMSLRLLEDGRVGPLNEEQQKLLTHISEDSQRLLNITGELLDLAQVETGNIRLVRRSVAVSDLLQFAAKAVEVQADQKKVGIHLQPDTALPELNLDPDKTTWVLVNLLTNAIRHSAEGAKVEVGVSRHESEVVFSVRDTGSGIAPEHQAHLFERFYQSPGKGNTQEGSGLGLAIAKDFIEAQGGRIWMESALGKGATFYFAFPLNKLAQDLN